MRLLCLLLLLVNFTNAQNAILVKDAGGKVLPAVSIFKTGAGNTLLSVTDDAGRSTFQPDRQASYLFHLLGYEDQVVTGEVLYKQQEIVLSPLTNEIKAVDVNKTRYKVLKILNAPGNQQIAESNHILKVIERVTFLNVPSSGFLKSYTLFGNQRKPGAARIFRFVLYRSDNGRPGAQLARLEAQGMLQKGKMNFNLAGQSIYLESGDYFIGYETSSSLKPEDTAHKPGTGNYNSSSADEEIFVKGKTSKQPKAFVRYNLNNWTLMSKGENGKAEYNEMAYQIELNIPVNK